MAKKSSSKTNKKKAKAKFYRDKRFILLAVFVVFAGILFFGIKSYQNQKAIEAEKNDLLAKHAQLEKIADEIAEKYPPDSRESSRNCRYASQKFGKGPLSCSVKVKFTYDMNRISDANEMVAIVAKDQGFILHVDSTVNNKDQPVFGVKKQLYNSDVSYLVSDLPNTDGCSVSFEYKESVKTLDMSLSCLQSRAKAEHFEVVN